MCSAKIGIQLTSAIVAAVVLSGIVMLLPSVANAQVACNLEYNLGADLPIGKFPPNDVENPDFMLLSWNHFLALNAPEVGGQVSLIGDNETQWSQWSSTGPTWSTRPTRVLPARAFTPKNAKQ